jgi:hypothetical protein
MIRSTALGILSFILSAPAWSQNVVEPKSGVAFPPRSGDMSLLGVGLRTKTFLRVKVYAIGLYVADSALREPLAAHKGALGSPAFFKDLVAGDFEKELVLKFVRGVTANQIQGAFREVLTGADPSRVRTFLAFFGDTKEGEEYRLHWLPGGILETTAVAQPRPQIPDKVFASAVFGIWLGEKPVQDDIKTGLVARAADFIK